MEEHADQSWHLIFGGIGVGGLQKGSTPTGNSAARTGD
jgi:hypothetical protein